jgi:single-strand DNA-binding protein
MSAPITITGNIVNDPELKFTPNGKALAVFTVVTSKSSKKPDGTWDNVDTTFWDVKAWGKIAENCADSLGKGMSVIVVGTALQENWDDKVTGAKRSKIVVTAWNIGIDMKRHTVAQVSTPKRTDTSNTNLPSDPWSAPISDIAPF